VNVRSTRWLHAFAFIVLQTAASNLAPQASASEGGEHSSAALEACASHFLKDGSYRCLAVATFEDGPCQGGRCLRAREPDQQVLGHLRRRFPGLRGVGDCQEASDVDILWVRATEGGEGWPAPYVAVWPAGRMPGFHAATGCETTHRLFGGWKVKLHHPID
jgi:hypothetical protein